MRGGQGGVGLLEAVLALGIIAILALLGLTRLDVGHPGLLAVQGELRGAVEGAMLQARAQGGTVDLSLKSPRGPLRPLTLPRGVAWGLPEGVRPPSGMDPPLLAHRTGEAHAVVPVTPRTTALASVWFLKEGQDALCLRLNGHGQLTLLRWRNRQQEWRRL